MREKYSGKVMKKQVKEDKLKKRKKWKIIYEDFQWKNDIKKPKNILLKNKKKNKNKK